ncbi:MAG TPA: hypothetical protein VHL09_15245 [Dehalococcoidia bacterium]|nr:hypothetical protein [Dehalococcoidia bacterium]
MAQNRMPSSPAVDLQSIKEILRMYCQGLTGKDVQILPSPVLAPAKGSVSPGGELGADTYTVFLPEVVRDHASRDANFEAYKVFSAHQSAHLEWGTFEFSSQREAAHYTNFRAAAAAALDYEASGNSEFDSFFGIFPDRKLADDLFSLIEDTRIDQRLTERYRGLRRVYRQAQEDILGRRPGLESLPLREVLLEVLTQASLMSRATVRVPQALLGPLREAAGLIQSMRAEQTSVEDAAEVTLRLYSIVQSVPNLPPEAYVALAWEQFDLATAQSIPDIDVERVIDSLRTTPPEQQQQQPGESGQSEQPYKSPAEVPYRSGIQPQHVRRQNKPENDTSDQDSDDPNQQQPSPEMQAESESGQDEEQLSPTQMPSGDDSDPSDQEQFARMQAELQQAQAGEQQGDFKEGEAQNRRPLPGQPTDDTISFYYDEWDFLVSSYKPQWCRLRQKTLEEGSQTYFEQTIRNHAGLVHKLRRVFERMRPEELRRINRLQDGEEFDLDAVIDAVVDRRSGVTPSDKLYRKRQKETRDVAVVFLLDMSASTYEKIDPLGGRRPGARGGPWQDKRIIDVEKEGIVILTEALEAIGDTYGIYAFSGHGRDNAEFFVIKDIAETLTSTVKRRIDRLAPARGTRMGPAIRHGISILERNEAKTRLLFLFSDGRPQDHDYGAHHMWQDDPTIPYTFGRQTMIDNANDYIRREYAIYDTKMALVEAKRNGITPFCLTIDKAGHEYLKAMCGDIGYEILDDVRYLPKRLPSLYRALTT